MNKKLLLLPTLLLLVGCVNNNKESKVLLSYSSRIDTNATLLNYKGVLDRVNNEESFILALIPGSESEVTCSCWRTFSYIIDNYVKNNDRIIYKADVIEIAASDDDFGLKAPTSQDPGLAIFENGTLKKQYFYSIKNTPTYFKNGEALASFLNEKTTASKLVYIDDETLDNKINNHETFIVSYVRKGCGDCGYVLPNVFLPYVKEHTINDELYLLDMEELGIYITKAIEQPQSYYDYKNRMGLSLEGNATYGYSGGVVPTTHYIKNGEIYDANVFFNDSIAQNENDQWYISSSYYTEARKDVLKYTDAVIEGLLLDDKDIVDYEYKKIEEETHHYYFLSEEKGAELHTPILTSFLDTYLK